jgi:hypothetical protein
MVVSWSERKRRLDLDEFHKSAVTEKWSESELERQQQHLVVTGYRPYRLI